MEEVIGSIPIRSTNFLNQLQAISGNTSAHLGTAWEQSVSDVPQVAPIISVRHGNDSVNDPPRAAERPAFFPLHQAFFITHLAKSNFAWKRTTSAVGLVRRIGRFPVLSAMLHIVYLAPRGCSSLSPASAGGQLLPSRSFVLRRRSDRHRSTRALKSKHPEAFQSFPEPLQFADRLA